MLCVCVCVFLKLPVSSRTFLPIPAEDFHLPLARMNVDKRNGKNSERRKLSLKKKHSSALFPLTGNCVFDLSHRTHLVIACEVSLLPTAEGRRKFAIAAVAPTPAQTTRGPPKDEKIRLHILINLGLRSAPDGGARGAPGESRTE